MKRSDIFRWALALLILAFGVLSHDPGSGVRWSVLSAYLYGLPLLAQFVPRTWARVYGLYFGAFVLLQAVASPHFFPNTYIMHPPNINEITDVRGNNLAGISGPQHFTTDAKGFRTTKPIDYDDAASYRIFVFGPSTAAQDWIDDHKTFSHLVQESLSAALDRNVEVINVAIVGTRALHHLATMRRVASYHPDMFVIMPGPNDWGLQIVSHYDKSTPEQYAHALVSVTPNQYRIMIIDRFRNYTLEQTLLGRALDSLWTAIRAYWSRLGGRGGGPVYTINHGQFYAKNRGSLFRPDRRTFMPEAVSPSYADALQRIAGLCRESPFVCVIVTQPTGFKPGISREYMARAWMTPAFEAYTLTFESMIHIADLYNRYLVELGDRWGLPVCDLDSRIEASLKTFYDEMHFNIEGSRQAAAFLHTCLRDVILSKTSPKTAGQ